MQAQQLDKPSYSTQMPNVVAYQAISHEVRHLTERLVNRLEELQAHYPSEVLEQTLRELKGWQSQLSQKSACL
jgi:hypothetical protein